MTEAVILAHEGLDRLQTVEPHQSLEFDLSAVIALHQIDVAEARDLPRFNAGDHFPADDSLISVGILGRAPAAPEAANHFRASFCISVIVRMAISPIFASASGSSAFI